jgi:hypothetical protein
MISAFNSIHSRTKDSKSIKQSFSACIVHQVQSWLE